MTAIQRFWVFLIQEKDRSFWGLSEDNIGLLVASSEGRTEVVQVREWNSLPDSLFVLVSICRGLVVSDAVKDALKSQNCWVHFGGVNSGHHEVTVSYISQRWTEYEGVWGAMTPMPFSMTTKTPWDRCVHSLAGFLRATKEIDPEALGDKLKKIEQAWGSAGGFYALRSGLQRAVEFGFALFLQNGLMAEPNITWLHNLKVALETLDLERLQRSEQRLVQRLRTDSSPCSRDLLLLADVWRRNETCA